MPTLCQALCYKQGINTVEKRQNSCPHGNHYVVGKEDKKPKNKKYCEMLSQRRCYSAYNRIPHTEPAARIGGCRNFLK